MPQGFMRVAGRRFGFAFAVSLALAAPLAALAAMEPDPGYVWSAHQFEGNASLIYGSPETAEDFTFFLFCDNGKKEAELTVYEEIKDAEIGKPISIEIDVGSAKIALKGETATDEMSGFVFGMAKTIAVKPLLAVLEASGPASVKMGQVTTTLPEKGRAAAVSEFAKACTLD